MIPTIRVERLIAGDIATARKLITSPVNLVLADTTILVDERTLLLSLCIWKPFEEWLVPDSTMLVSEYYDGNYLTDKHIIKLSEHIYKTIATSRPELANPILRFESGFNHAVMQGIQNLWNEVAYPFRHLAQVGDILYFKALAEDPEVLALYAGLDLTDIEQLKVAVRNVITGLKKLKAQRSNPLIRAVIAGVIPAPQLFKILVAIGPRTLLTGDIVSRLINTSYLTGVTTATAEATETLFSQNAAMSLEKPTQDAGAAVHQGRLLTTALEEIDYGVDCGTTKTMDWYVAGPDKESGYTGDLIRIVGMNYVLDDGTLKSIELTDKHLEGTYIKLRNPFQCEHHVDGVVCEACVGAIAQNMPIDTNIGVYAFTFQEAIAFQLELSRKHDIEIASAKAIMLNNVSGKFFNITEDGLGFVLRSTFDGLTITFAGNEISRVFAALARDVREVSPEALGKVKDVVVAYRIGDKQYSETVNMMDNRRRGHLSTIVFAMMKNESWRMTINADQSMTLDLTGYAGSEIVRLPGRIYSTGDISKLAHRKIIGSGQQKSAMGTTDWAETVEEVFRLVNEKTNIPLIIWLLIARAYKGYVTSVRGDDLTEDDMVECMLPAHAVLEARSLAGNLFFGGQVATLIDPDSGYSNDYPGGPYEGLLDPAGG